MLGKSLASPVLSLESAHRCAISKSDISASAPKATPVKLSWFDSVIIPNSRTDVIRGGAWTSVYASRKWKLHAIAETEILPLNDEEKNMWEACRQALSVFNFSAQEEDKMLGKAFGQLHSPYWGEERKKEIPKFEIVNEVLHYLRSLGLSDDDLTKLLKKFPEVLGCSLEDELRTNVRILDEEWGIKGKSLRNLLLRNPKVLGYNVDCKGDCMAQCTRCWVRF